MVPLVLSVSLERVSALAEGMGVLVKDETGGGKKPRTVEEEIEMLLTTPSVRETENKRMGAEVCVSVCLFVCIIVSTTSE